LTLRPMQKILSNFLMMLFVIMTYAAVAQDRTVSGVVRSSDGPLPGASVSQKGTVTGTITDSDGRFSIALTPGSDAVIIVSFIGYEQQEISLSPGQTTVDVVLTPDVHTLGEVVVVGY